MRPGFSLFCSLGLTTALTLVSGCAKISTLDWDLRGNGKGTSSAAKSASENRPEADSRGVITYPGYQVAVAKRGDTVGSVASRIGVDGAQLATFNALSPTDPLRGGEILALPQRIAGEAATTLAPASAITGGAVTTTGIDVAPIASAAIDRADAAKGSRVVAPAPEPGQHRVARGETALTIAARYNVTPEALASWNGLGKDLGVREGQFLMIPPASAVATATEVTAPGEQTPAPLPPSAAKPLPAEKTTPPVTATGAKAAVAGTPPSPDLGAQQTVTSAGGKFANPLAGGAIIRTFSPPKSQGIDISASPGAPIVAAADGSVAAITKNTVGVPIVVIKHSDGVLTVYGGVDALTVAKGAAVKRGQKIGVLRAGDPSFLHFEVRKGLNAVDPEGYIK